MIEIISPANMLLIGSVLLLVSIFVAKMGYRYGLPSLLLFLGVGMMFGSDGFGYQFDNARIAQFIGTIALCVILFSGGMDTKYSAIKPIIKHGVILSTVGVLLTTLLTGGFIYLVLENFELGIKLTVLESMLLAAVMSSTDSASVFSILGSRSMGLKQNLRPLLEFESGSNDPMAYMLTITLVGVITAKEHFSLTYSVFMFVLQMGIGLLSGWFLGKLAVWFINKINLAERSLYVIILIATVFLIYSFTEQIKGNGFLAVYVGGLVLGNHKIVYRHSLANFFDGITWFVQIAMFVTLGLLVNPSDLWPTAIIGVILALFLIFVGRPLAVFLSIGWFRNISFGGKLYVSWVGLRGAVPIIFATYPLIAGIDCAHFIFNVVFFITIVSLVVQGTTVDKFARFMGLAESRRKRYIDIDTAVDELRHLIFETLVDEEMLASGDMVENMYIPAGYRILVIKRGNKYVVPKGRTNIYKNDVLLLIKDTGEQYNK